MTLFPLHFFGTFNKNDVIDRMSCLFYNDSELCFEQSMRDCALLHSKKEPEYDTCALKAY
jgi:hypothetical protein